MNSCAFVESMIVSPSDFIVQNDQAWFIHASLNALFSLDINTGILTYHGRENYKLQGEEPPLYAKLIPHLESIYLIPWNSKKITIYNKKERLFKDIDNCSYDDCLPFKTAFKIDNKIICIPFFLRNKVAVIDLTNNEIECNLSIAKDVPIHSKYIRDLAMTDNGVLVCCLGESSDMLCYDINQRESVVVNLNNSARELVSCTCLNSNVYVLEEGGTITVMDSESLKIVDRFEIDVRVAKIHGYGSKSLLIDPYDNRNIQIYDICEHKKESLNGVFSRKKFPYIWNRAIGCLAQDENKNAFYCDGISNSVVNLQTGTRVNMQLSDESAYEIRDAVGQICIYADESELYGLEDFLNHVF